MRSRLAPICLLITFTLLGTGVLRFAHDLSHLHEDAAAAAAHNHDGESSTVPLPIHTEWNCDLHALLAAPLLATAVVPLLILLGLLVAFLTQLQPAPVSRHPSFRRDCRGPPAC